MASGGKATKNNGVKQGGSRIPSQVTTEMAYILLSMIGCIVRISLDDGSEWEGLFDSLRDGQVSISLAKQICAEGEGRLEGMARWPMERVKWIKAEAVDLEECREGRVPSTPRSTSFQTDGEISAKDAKVKERDLKPWQADAEEEHLLESLPTGNERTGWDQFAVNQSLFGVTTSFDESQYTTPLPDASDPGFAERAKEAERIAQEILHGQSTSTSSWHLREERGEELDNQVTEEDLYGAVLTAAPAKSKTSWASLAANAKDTAKDTKKKSSQPPAQPQAQPAVQSQAQPPVQTQAQKSLVNRQTDPQALEEAIQSVEQSQKSLQRRLSQLSNGESKTKLNPEAPEWKPRVDAPAFTPSSFQPTPHAPYYPPPPQIPYYKSYLAPPPQPPAQAYGVYINGLFVPNYMLNVNYPNSQPPPPPPSNQ